MAHFAKLNENNVVEFVVVVDNEILNNAPGMENEETGINYLKNIFGENTIWKQTSYHHNFRCRMAAPSYVYDIILDCFIPPKPYDSWYLDMDYIDWAAPIPYPQDGNSYIWDEENQVWIIQTE